MTRTPIKPSKAGFKRWKKAIQEEAATKEFTPLKRSAPPKRTRLKRSAPPKQPKWVLDFWEWVRAQPCLICELQRAAIESVDADMAGTFEQLAPTEAAHVGVRGLRQKCDPREVLPLCGVLHHRLGPYSAHRLGKRFWEFHGLDRRELLIRQWTRYEIESGVSLGLGDGMAGKRFKSASNRIPVLTDSEGSTGESEA